MADDATLQLFQRTFNQCNGDFTRSTHAKKPVLRQADVLGKLRAQINFVENREMGELA